MTEWLLYAVGGGCGAEDGARYGLYLNMERSGGTIAVHFVNAGGACLKPGDKITSVIPKTPFPPITADITFSFIGEKAKSAVATSPDFEGERILDVLDDNDGGTSIVLPKQLIKAYTLVRIKPVTGNASPK